MLVRLALFAATPLGKWIIGAAEAALGAFLFTLISTTGGLGLSEPLNFLIGSMLGSIAGRLGIPMPPVAPPEREA